MVVMNINKERLKLVYSGTTDDLDNWGSLPNFLGGFLNFEFWEDINLQDDKPITDLERIRSSSALYDLLCKSLNITEEDVVLEVGCGRGVGINHINEQYHPSRIIGIDLSENQISASKERLKGLSNVELFVTEADKTKLPSGSIDKVISVEVLQHFPSIEDFAIEMKRILKVGTGKLAVCTYFPINEEAAKKLYPLLPLIEEKIENPMPIDRVIEAFLEAGFKEVDKTSIGKDVFRGYNKWLAQMKIKTPFSYNYYKSFKSGYLDYYLITAS